MSSDMAIFTLCFGKKIAESTFNKFNSAVSLEYLQQGLPCFIKHCIVSASSMYDKGDFCKAVGMSTENYSKFQDFMKKDGKKKDTKGENRVTCEFCGKCFANKHLLKRHIVQHTGEKPYKCEFCEKAFTQKTNMTRHQKKVHS